MGNSLICIASPTTSEEAREMVQVNSALSTNYTKNNSSKSYHFDSHNSTKCISVVDCVEGQVTHMAPVQVAELMLEYTGCFVVHVEEEAQECTERGPESILPTRLRPMAACEETSPGHVYMAVPMDRLNQRVSPQDWEAIHQIIALIHVKRSSDSKPAITSNGGGFTHRGGGARVTPLLTSDVDTFQDQSPSNGNNNNCDAIREILNNIFNKSGAAPAIQKDLERCSSILHSKPWVPKLDTISE